ncbi:MAG: ATP-binding protein [bacterium]
MDSLNQPDLFKATLWLIALVFFIFFLFIYGFRKIRQGVKDAFNPDGAMESGKVTESDSDMAFVFNTFQNTLKDISDRKHELIRMHRDAEERIRQVERYNQCILESMVSGVITFDREGDLTSMNLAAAEILGWTKDVSPVGKSFEDVLDGSDHMKEILNKVLEENRKILREETTFTMQNGDRRWLGVNASPLKGDDGEMIGTTIVFTDLTEVKELQRQVELKNRLADLGKMSAGIAHEFRNSLGAILGYARLAERQAVDNGILRDSVEGIMTEVKNFDAMLTDFLNFARPVELNREACSLSDLVKESLDVLSEETGKRGAKVETIFENAFPVFADHIQMRQALTNLIKNALEAVGDQGEIRIQGKRIAGRSELWIHDNGCGISMENHKKIFEPFFTTKREGTGLGLAITQKTILSHQGSLTIRSEQGEGTLVIVSLPIHNAPV